MNKLVGLFLKSRGARHVTRFCNSPRIKENNIAEHQYYVALYTKLLCDYLQINDEDTVDAIGYALIHDLHEGISIDIPQNVKRRTPSHSDGIESCAVHELGLNRAIPEVGMDIVKIADLLDALIYSIEEVRMGNGFFYAPIAEIKGVLNDKVSEVDEKLFEAEIFCKRGALIEFYHALLAHMDADKILTLPPDTKSMTHIHKGFRDGKPY